MVTARTTSMALCIVGMLGLTACHRTGIIQPSTVVVRYTPPTNLPNSGREGYCWRGSIAAPYRMDAWRCMEGNAIHDPCFELMDKQAVVCGANPVKGEKGFRLNLTKPLPTPEPHPATSDKNQAWLVELGDGAVCTPFTGTRPFISGQAAYYGCTSKSSDRQVLLLGDLGNSKPLWTAKRATLVKHELGWKIESTETVPVKAVWR
jgi:hypothetical protein